jgi:8-oxo-dGTP diphosphatase
MILDGTESVPFDPIMKVAGCFVFCKDEFLLLERQEGKPQAGTWGIPGGKIGAGEPWSYAVRRELYEETGLMTHLLHYYGQVRVRYPAYDFIYAMFGTFLERKMPITRNDTEHSASLWVTLGKSRTLPLIQDMDSCIARVIARSGCLI